MKPSNAASLMGKLSQQKHPRGKEYMRNLALNRWAKKRAENEKNNIHLCQTKDV